MGEYLIIFLNLIIAEPAYAQVDCVKNPIFCQIVKNKKTIDKAYAMELSNIVHTVSKKYGVDPKILTAIMAQESMYEHKDARVWAEVDGKPKQVSVDIGITQLNIKTISDYGFSLDKIRSSIEYAIECSAIVLRKKFKICRSRGASTYDSWFCYHSYTEKYQIKYESLVSKYL